MPFISRVVELSSPLGLVYGEHIGPFLAVQRELKYLIELSLVHTWVYVKPVTGSASCPWVELAARVTADNTFYMSIEILR